MARKEETLVSRIQGCTRTIHFSVQRMGEFVTRIEELEKYLKRDETALALFRLQTRSLRQELEMLGQITKDED